MKKIGIIDQTKTFPMYMATLLRRMGFEAVQFNSIADFIKEYCGSVDLVFLGDSIQDESTVSGVKVLRDSLDDKIRIVVVSVVSDKNVKNDALNAGASDYIFKPIHPKDVHKVVIENLEYPSGKRINLRASFEERAELDFGDSTEKPPVLSLSRGGAFIQTRLPIPTGTKLKIKLLIDISVESLDCIVIYNRKTTERGHEGTAVYFMSASEKVKQSIDMFLEQSLLLDARKAISSVGGNIITESKHYEHNTV